MSMYLGSGQSFKVVINGEKYSFNVGSFVSFIEKIRLLTSDNYILKDGNGNYLLPKESE